MTIWTLGNAVVGLLPRDNMRFKTCAGGIPFNVAISIARLGRASGFIGRVGSNTFGRFLYQTLGTAQVDTGSLEFDIHQHTSAVLVSLAPSGGRQLEFLVNPSTDQFLNPASLPDFSTDILHFCSLVLVAPDYRATLVQATTALRQIGGILNFDISLRPQMWGNKMQMFDLINEFARRSDILKISGEELLWLIQTNCPSSTCERLVDFPTHLKIVTHGVGGTIAFRQDSRLTLSGYNVEDIDTTGAGNAFMAGLLTTLAGESQPTSTSTLFPLIEQANACGALAIARCGALSVFPDNQHLSNFTQSQPSLRRTTTP